MSQRAETQDNGTEVPTARTQPSFQPPAEAKWRSYRVWRQPARLRGVQCGKYFARHVRRRGENGSKLRI